jgi:class 3 adenylate cyclase/predicted ATPase
MHVVFCDVVGSTTLSAQLDPEDLRDLLQQFQLLCHQVVGRFDGYIAQFLGDGVLVYFGYPHAHEDDAHRAVRAGLEIVRAVSGDKIGGHRLRVRVGIHSGLVVVGEVGVPGRRSELAVGETPNIAARVQGEALPDTVAISDATERLVRGFFVTEELGPRSLRGLKETMKLFAVTGESGARNRLEAATGALTTFVARREALATLARCWEETCAGRGQIVSVRGEAGVGKSRLVQAFLSTLTPAQFDLVECGCSEHLRNTAFHPIAGALWRRMDLDGANSPEKRMARLESYAEGLRTSSPPPAGVLADLLSIPVDRTSGLHELTPSRRRQLTMETVSNWLLSPAGDRPRLAVLEDVHWTDASTLELIEGLAARLSSSRVLLLATLRPEFTPPWAADNATVLQLHPLSQSDAATMASHVAKGKALPPQVTNRIDEWTRGVPLYIEEFTKGLLESGVLHESAERFDLSGPLPRSLIPETLAGPLTARIDRLGPAKPVIQLAAVIGMEVRYDMLVAVSESSEIELEGALDRLLASELLVDSKTQPGAVFHFRHALIRDAAHNSLLLADRRDIHGRVVHAMQSKFAELGQRRPEIVAYHAGEAGLADLAVSEWTRAGKMALARAQNVEALAHIDEGMRQLERLDPGTETLEKQLALELDRGPALMTVKGFATLEVRATYRLALELCEKLGDPTRMYPILWGLWANQFVAGELVPARDFSEQVFALAQATGDPSLLVPACHALGYTTCHAAEFDRSLELARLGIKLLDLDMERRNVPLYQFSSAVAVRHIGSVCLWMLGFPEQARTMAREAMELVDALAHPPTTGYAQSALTWGAPFLRGDIDGVDAAAAEATRVSVAGEFSFWPPFVRIFQGWAVATRGDVRAGLAHMRAGYPEWRGMGGGILRPTIHAFMARATWKDGDAREALKIVSDAFTEIASTQEHFCEPELHRVRGEVLASLGSESEAEASFRAALALARRQRAKSLELRAAIALTRFQSERSRAEEGLSMVRSIYDSFTEGFDTPDLREAQSLLA